MALMDARQRSTMLPAAPGFGAWLRDTRDAQSLSLRALACLMACHESSLSRIERRQRRQRRPCRETAIALADALGVVGAERIEALSLAGYIEQPLTDEQALILATWDDVIAAG